jgi:hypothetical protein
VIFTDEKTKAGKSAQSIQAIREPPLMPLVPDDSERLTKEAARRIQNNGTFGDIE